MSYFERITHSKRAYHLYADAKRWLALSGRKTIIELLHLHASKRVI